MEWVDKLRREAVDESASEGRGGGWESASDTGSRDFHHPWTPSAQHPLGDVPILPPRSPLPNGRALLASRQAERRWSSQNHTGSDTGHGRGGGGGGGSFTDASPTARHAPASAGPASARGAGDAIAHGWEALQGPLAALFLDEPPVDVQRHVAQLANKNKNRALAVRDGHPEGDAAQQHHQRGISWEGGPGRGGLGAAETAGDTMGDGGANGGRRGERANRPVGAKAGAGPNDEAARRGEKVSGGGGGNRGGDEVAGEAPAEALGEKVGNWLKDLWSQLIEEEDDDNDGDGGWRDGRRGQGGTPSGAEDLRNVEDGQETEMELVITPETDMSLCSGGGISGYATHHTLGSAAQVNGHGSGGDATPAAIRGGGGGGRLGDGGSGAGFDSSPHGASPATPANPDGQLHRTPGSHRQHLPHSHNHNSTTAKPRPPPHHTSSPVTYSFDDDLDSFGGGMTSAPSPGAKLPDVFPGRRPTFSPYAGAEATALEVQRLWGNPGRFVSFDDCRAVLVSLPEARSALVACDAAIQRFNFAYNTPPSLGPEERLVAWRSAALDLCSALLRALIASGGRLDSCATTPRHRESLLNVVEGYVMGGVQEKVLDGISRTFIGDDATFDAALSRIERLPPEAMGMHPSHMKAVDTFAIGSLRGLGRLSCPRHMATAVCDVMRHLAGNCARLRTWSEEEKAEQKKLRATANVAAAATAAHLNDGEGGGLSENEIVAKAGGRERAGAGAGAGYGAGDDTGGGGDDEDEDEDEDEPASIPSTDDLLSLLVVLVAKARPTRAVSLAAYMDAFHALVGTAHKGELGFALANFLGAIQYIRSEQMGELLRKWEIPEPPRIPPPTTANGWPVATPSPDAHSPVQMRGTPSLSGDVNERELVN